MAKEITPAAQATPELPGLKRRGRPATGKAMTNAERQAKYRASRKAPAQVPGEVAQVAVLAIRQIQDSMLDRVMEIGQLNDSLRLEVEGWYRSLFEVRKSLE